MSDPTGQTLAFANDDGSVVRLGITYQWTPGPPVPPPPPPAPFRIGTSWRSATEAANWPNTRFGLLFFNPANGTPYSSAVVSAAITRYPQVLWCVCDKGDPSVTVPSICTLAHTSPLGLWFVYDQEPEGDDPVVYQRNVRLARSLIDAAGARDSVKLVGKFARYPNIQTPGLWKKYWCGTPDNPVEDVFATDDYARPGIQFPTTRYGTSAELFGWGFDAAEQCNVPHAVTEYARLPLATDTQGTLLADQIADDFSYLRANHAILASYWAGKGDVADFTPLPAPRSAIKTIIRSQG